MAIVTNTFTTYSAKGIREDLSNIITNISPLLEGRCKVICN